PNKSYRFNDFKVVSEFDEEKVRHITIDSKDAINGNINGVFQFKDLGKLVLNSTGSLYTNYEPFKVKEGQYIDFNVKVSNQLVEVFYPDISIGENTRLKGKVGSDEQDFRLSLKTPFVKIGENKMNKINIKIDNKNPLFNTFVKIDEVRTSHYDIDNFRLINKTLNDTLFFKTEFVGGKNKNDKFDLNLYHTINTDNKSVIGFKKSKINFNKYDWYVNEDNNKKNRIIFDNNLDNIRIEDFFISNQDQFVELFGVMEKDSEKDITLNLKEIDIAKLLPESKDFDIRGILDGNIHVFQHNKEYFPKGTLIVEQLEVNEQEMGVFQLEVTGDDALSNYQINGVLENHNFKTFSAQGNIDFSTKTPEMNIDTYFDEFKLSILEPIAVDVFTDIRGSVTGGANFLGSIDKPEILGILYLKDAGMNIPYLNVDLDLEDNASVSLVDHQFLFNNIAILDTKYLTSGRLNGFIEHQSFSDWVLGLKLSTNNMLVLDTELEEDSLYYGTAFIAGEANIQGPTDALVIDVVAQTKENTTFKIPIRDSESIGDNSFIRFISEEEKNQIKIGQETVFDEVQGLEMNFDLDVTRDAEIEIVIDQKTGSTLRGRGAGSLLVEINTNGKFNMYGDFVTYEGTYNFIYGGLIEKRFRVQPGGTINWEGDPFAAQLDINAVYSTDANPAILLDNATINRKIPVDVVINLTNQLLQPDVDFNIKFPKTSSVIESELQYKLQDKENRELQALSLVTSGSFVNRLSVGNGAVVGNLTERAKSILDDILSDEDDKFNIGLNFEQGERTPDSDIRTDDRLGVTLSTKISDRILINGKVGVPVGGVNETVVVGDVEVEFLLNEDGTLRAKVFNRENDFQALGFGEEIGYTQGVGLSYQVDFDSFKELMQKIFKKAKEEEQEKAPVDDNTVPDFIRFKE
ncbi:MAG: translocation/assembly module TamB, partial [Flavobacteriaceae bacterium]|nr:translocation/assembly module TamB [Flavobacteriaceae bacterium]